MPPLFLCPLLSSETKQIENALKKERHCKNPQLFFSLILNPQGRIPVGENSTFDFCKGVMNDKHTCRSNPADASLYIMKQL